METFRFPTDSVARWLEAVRSVNPFQRRKLSSLPPGWVPDPNAGFGPDAPFTTKAELAADQTANPPYGTNLTHPQGQYTRCHQTSGTTGSPLRWLDTPGDWSAMVGDWTTVLKAAGVTSDDRILFAFSFGPFLGFWLAFEAGQRCGALCFAGGGMSSAVRAKLLSENDCTVLCCTPTYALHLGEVFRKLGLKAPPLRRIVVAGEPGGSLPAVRRAIESAWPGASVFDHHGLTETGPVTHEVPGTPGTLMVLPHRFIAEIVVPGGREPVVRGGVGELILTPLGRIGMPLFRYRTGDLVRGHWVDGQLHLAGGILGRADDMVIVRGVNVYPSAIDELVRSVPDIGEYRVRVDRSGALVELGVEVEGSFSAASELEGRIHDSLALRVPVRVVPDGTLPRFELKARRWMDVGV